MKYTRDKTPSPPSGIFKTPKRGQVILSYTMILTFFCQSVKVKSLFFLKNLNKTPVFFHVSAGNRAYS